MTARLFRNQASPFASWITGTISSTIRKDFLVLSVQHLQGYSFCFKSFHVHFSECRRIPSRIPHLSSLPYQSVSNFQLSSTQEKLNVYTLRWAIGVVTKRNDWYLLVTASDITYKLTCDFIYIPLCGFTEKSGAVTLNSECRWEYSHTNLKRTHEKKYGRLSASH